MAMSRLALSMELIRHVPSQFTNYNYNSFAATPDGQVLGFNEDGIFVLDAADSDAIVGDGDPTPIVSRIRFARTNFGVMQQKRIRALTLYGEFKGAMKVNIKGNEQHQVIVGAAPRDTSGRQGGLRAKFPRTCRGNGMDIELENHQGSDFSVDAIDAHLTVLGQL